MHIMNTAQLRADGIHHSNPKSNDFFKSIENSRVEF
jgi:hypothetical protein